MRVLIIEDEKKLALALVEILRSEQIEADVAYDGIQGLDDALSGIYDAIILDLMLPALDGMEVLSQLRAAKLNTPVLILTAKSSLDSKVEGLDSGADYYLTKPFEKEELIAVLRAISRRSGKIQPHILSYGDLTLDRRNFTISSGDIEISLASREFQVMELLLINRDQISAKEYILVKVWGTESEAVENHVEVYISFLRRKLRRLNSKVEIRVRRGLGYYLYYPETERTQA